MVEFITAEQKDPTSISNEINFIYISGEKLVLSIKYSSVFIIVKITFLKGKQFN